MSLTTAKLNRHISFTSWLYAVQTDTYKALVAFHDLLSRFLHCWFNLVCIQTVQERQKPSTTA